MALPAINHTRLRRATLADLEIRIREFRNVQRRGLAHAEADLNAALETWIRVHDRLVLEPYDWEEDSNAAHS